MNTTTEIQDKLQHLLLNKVDSFSWQYFELESAMNAPPAHNPPQSINHLFERIAKDGLSGYKYSAESQIINTRSTPPLGTISGSGSNPSATAVGVASEATRAETSECIMKLLIPFFIEKPRLLEEVVRELLNQKLIPNNSQSEKGLMGKLNERERKRRAKKFKKKIRNGFRADPKNIVLLAEGDSWFQFPKLRLPFVNLGKDVVKDIVDWLIKKDRYAVQSLAAGGDWLSNIFHTMESFKALANTSPDVFLLSGGGNDLAGGNRVASLVINPAVEDRVMLDDPTKYNNDQTKEKYFQLFEKRKSQLEGNDLKAYKRGLGLLNEEFFHFINLGFILYFTVFNQIKSDPKFAKMVVVSHGYDYPIPSNKKRGGFISSQFWVNKFLDSGRWLYHPLNLKGVTNTEDQKSVMFAMLYEFNEMLIQLNRMLDMPNFFHIDCRGFAKSKDWFDELHLKSSAYKKIATVFEKCIDENVTAFRTDPEYAPELKDRIYKVIDEFQ